MNSAKKLVQAVDEFPTLAMLALYGDRNAVSEFIEDGDLGTLDLETIMETADEATAYIDEDETMKIAEREDASYVEIFEWPDGSRIVLVFGTDQDPDRFLVIDPS